MGLLDHGHASSLEKGNPPNFKTHLQRQNHPFSLRVRSTLVYKAGSRERSTTALTREHRLPVLRGQNRDPEG